MSFFSSPEYLTAVSEAYFPDRSTSIEQVRIGNEAFRLLVVDKKKVITSFNFLDYHQPLKIANDREATRNFSHIPCVTREIMTKEEWCKNRPNAEIAPFINWSLFPSFEDYKALITRQSHVKEYMRRRRKLEKELGKVEFTMNDEGDDVFAFARRCKSKQLRETGSKDWMAAPENINFFEKLKNKGLLTSSTLRVNGRLAAVWQGYVYDNVWSGWIFTFDPEFKKYSVGHQLLHEMLEMSYRLKHKEFDFSIGEEEYKLIYATHVRVLGTVGHPPLTERLIVATRKAIKGIKLEAKKQTPHAYGIAKNFRKKVRKFTLKTYNPNSSETCSNCEK